MRTRLKDVAERVSLSPALVSGVLNGKANVWASEETRSRVFKAASDLNYHPNSAAKSLSGGKTHTVALVYRRLEGIHYRLAYTGLVDTFSAELQKRGYSLTVSNFATQEEVLDHLRRTASGRACDAVILWGRESDTEAQGLLLEKMGMPFLVKGRHEVEHPHWRQIDFDHEWMMSNALDQLADRGRCRIAYLGFPHDDPYVQALRKGFIERHRSRFGTEPSFSAACPDQLTENVEDIEGWLDLPTHKRPDGFVMGAGNYAWHALEGCLARRGLTLGREVDAVGIASYYFSLTFGEAEAYQGIEIDRLASQVAEAQLDALLTPNRPPSVIRFRPRLDSAPSMRLSNVLPVENVLDFSPLVS